MKKYHIIFTTTNFLIVVNAFRNLSENGHLEAKNLSIVREYVSEMGVELLGRFGEWEYPNMNVCIEKAMIAAKEYERHE